MAGLDYGVVIFKNRKKYKESKLYPVIDELGGLNFYKYWAYADEDGNKSLYRAIKEEHIVNYIDNDKFTMKVKWITDYTLIAKIRDKITGDKYVAIYGYGIDNNKEVWNDGSRRFYLSKKDWRKTNRLLTKYGF